MATIAARFLRGLGLALKPVGFAAGVWQAYHPSDRGWRGDIDRAAGVISATSPVVEAGVALELIATPGVGEAVLVIGAGVALWTLGDLAYDEREAIAHAFATSGTYIVQTAGKSAKVIEANPAILLGPAADVANFAWNKRAAIGAVAADTVRVGDRIGGEVVHEVGKAIEHGYRLAWAWP